MRYFEVDTLGDEQDKERVFIEEEPEGLDGFGFRLAEGDSTDDVYPEDARIYLSPYSAGLKLSTLLGNSIGYLIVHAALMTILKEHAPSGVEYRRFSLYNQRRRLHSQEYWIINPLTLVPCLDREHSRIQYATSNPDQIVGIDELVFDSQRLEAAPDLFRIPEQRMSYFISERIARALQGQGFDNLFLQEIRQHP
ncbi:hypothetical protein DRW03_15855 [Corallococcus sp. H22C18031201]|uniref:imm11 family protein n=1 Tax=Citreicoccus inhibens TaxID=2849499 RepID=UPI000E7583EF|nr:DUF1629 domain-containing protein [Citreicoccus inhibens]MBU8899854.1 hypothetical protein [Citreicoccus inhibens]RJS21813.1 hypothetical protein DRW03_15855 [Corallococcus sp. H22C18031201]